MSSLKSKINSLKTVIILRYILITSLPILILGIAASELLYNHIQDDINHENSSIIKSIKNEFQYYISNTETKLKKIQSIVDDQSLINKDKINNYLSYELQQNLFNEFSILDSNGITIYTIPYNEDFIGIDLSNHPNYVQTKKHNNIFWSNTQYSIQGNSQTVNLSFPLRNNVVIGSINVARLINILELKTIRSNSFIGILDDKGVFVASTKDNFSDAGLTLDIFERIQNKLSNSDESEINIEDSTTIYTASRVSQHNWFIIVVNKKAELFDPLNQIIFIMILGITISIIIVAFLSIRSAKQIIKPLVLLNKQFENAANGDYQNIIEESKYTEFNATVAMFNKMIESINAREKIVINSEEKYRKLIENSPDPILIVTESKIVFASKSTLELVESDSIEEIKGREIVDFIPPNRKEEVKIRLKLTEKNFQKTFYTTEKIYTLKKKIKDVEIIIIPIIHEDKKSLQIIIRDITERLDSLAKIKLQSEALETAPSGITITNSDGIIVYANKAIAEISQYSKNEFIGEQANFLKSGLHDKDFYKEMWMEITKGKVWVGEVINRKKDGTLYPSYLAITGVRNEDNVITNYISIHEDITERKKFETDLIEAKEQAEKADKLKSEFLAQMSHEIRTPINAILSFASLLKDELESLISEELKPSFSIISNAGKRLIRTIDMILDMSDIQAGTYDFIPKKLHLYNDVVLPLIEEFKYSAKAKNLLMETKNISDDCFIYADEYTIKQVFSNLIDNAIKYTSQGKITIHVKEDAARKIVEVIDTGIGISKENISLIFQPFRQEDQGYTRKFEGNGLGLALVKKYCEINSAQIEVESEKSKGSIFRVIF